VLLLSIRVQQIARFLSNFPTMQVSLFCLSVDLPFIIYATDTITPSYKQAKPPRQSKLIKLSTTDTPSVSLRPFSNLHSLIDPIKLSAARLLGL